MAVKYKPFSISEGLTDEHITFFKQHGFLHFRPFLSQYQVKKVIEESERVQEDWIAQEVKKVNGIPIKYGFDTDGKPIVQRFSFLSHYSTYLKDLLADKRLISLLGLLNQTGRIAENEKNGMVFNHYVNSKKSTYKQLGWHTDALRDIFYMKKVGNMLNVGIHLDDVQQSSGGLRFLAGTHKQSTWNLLFRKWYFLDKKPDKREMGIEVRAGDLTVHDGRLWHRVQHSSLVGEASRRRVVYIPFIEGKYQPVNENSPTPLYMRMSKLTK